MSKAVSYTKGVRSAVLASTGTATIIEVADEKDRQIICLVDMRVGFFHPIQKTTEALITYLEKGVPGLRDKYGDSNVQLLMPQ